MAPRVLWPPARPAARNGYRGVVAKKSRNRGAGQSRAAAATPGSATAGSATARSATARSARGGSASGESATAGSAGGGSAGGGPGTAQLTAPAATEETKAYPGQRFGLPERGPGSVAPMGRRVLALLIDWLLCMLIAYWLTHSQFWTIAVFAVEEFILTATTGSTVGKRLLGIRVIRTNGGLVGFRWSLVRTAILLTVVPPLLADRDLRGLHDRAADTIVVRL